MPELGRYQYIHPYEWDHQRKVRVYTYPQDFFMIIDDHRPFVYVVVRTSWEELRKKVYLSDMTYLGE